MGLFEGCAGCGNLHKCECAMDLIEWQRKYDELVAHFCGDDISPEYRRSAEAWDVHNRIVRIIDGEEPDPRDSVPQQGDKP